MSRIIHRTGQPRGLGTLVVLAALVELVYVVAFLRPFPLLQYYRRDIDMATITGHSHFGYGQFVIGFTLLFVLFAIGWHHVSQADDARLLPWILGTGACFACTLIFVYPITAIDLYAYVDQSWIMVHYHQNPIFVPPSAFPADPLMPLSDGWSGIGSPYGPLGLVIDAVPTLIARGDLLTNLLLLKLLFSAMTLGCSFLVYRLLQSLAPRRALEGALLIAWNPFVLFETSVNGHNDIAMMVFALLALTAMLEGDHLLGTVVLTSACLIKFATLVLLPLFLVYGVARERSHRARAQFLVLAAASSTVVTIIAYARFWQGPETLAHLVDQNHRFLMSFSSVILDLWGDHVSGSVATFIGRLLFVGAFWAALVLSTRGPVDLLRACFLALFAAIAAGLTNVESWYGIWPVVLAAAVPDFASRITATVFAWGVSLAAAFFGYEWFWRGLNAPGSFQYINNKSYALAFLPALGVGIILARWPEAVQWLLALVPRNRSRPIGQHAPRE